MTCPVCGKEFDEHTGRRPKKFCSEPCKIKFFNAQKKVAKNNEPENKKKIEEDRQTQNKAQEEAKKLQPVSPDEAARHPLWKAGDPKEGSMAFFTKYGFRSYDELEKSTKNKK